MAEESLITPEVEAMMGQEVVFTGKEVVDKNSIRRYAQAIADLNPLYLDEEYAEKSKYGGIIAPPTYVFDVATDIFAEVGEDGRDLSRISVPGLKVVRGVNEYEIFEPVRPGDIISKTRKITSIYEKESKKAGKLLFIDYETTYTNQKKRVLGKARETMMFLK